MTAHLELQIGLDPSGRGAEFRLLDAHGSQIAYHHADIAALPASRRQGLFDLREYLRDYIEEPRHEAEIAAIGVCIAHELLGVEIFSPLWNPRSHRTLSIQLPSGAEQAHPLAAALARVPWELARPSASKESLAERNLVVHIEPPPDAAEPAPLQLEAEEPLRVLLVFAAARGSSPLAARSERRALLELFQREIYPNRRIVADVLSHGVTRERLLDQIQRNNGYHLLHWSGHGEQNLLELAGPDGRPLPISGQDLLELFIEAGGFLPQLVFLSACHSGAPRISGWDAFLAVAAGQEPAGATQDTDADLADQVVGTPAGYTGTASALLQGGVPTVVAMRFAVGDGYARQLAVAFYRHLLADSAPKDAASALAMARRHLRRPPPGGVPFVEADHATPLLYGLQDCGLPTRELAGRSPAGGEIRRRLRTVPELTASAHAHFVGRTWELAGLGAGFLGSAGGTEITPVAVVTGLGGMGKSALLAEALDLWESRFTWVLLYQARPDALAFEGTLRDIHIALAGEQQDYYKRVYLRDKIKYAIYFESRESFTQENRQQRMMENLCRAMRAEPILLVLDNFETNLRPQADPTTGSTGPEWSCQDPAWDLCLQMLSERLKGSASRVLITCRRPLSALADGRGYIMSLGPLERGEAALYLRAQPTLRRMVFRGDEYEKMLALRILTTSRFHPLLMDCLAKLARDPARRGQLTEALEVLNQKQSYSKLPELFSSSSEASTREMELAYLADALTTSTDQLISEAGAEARQLLRVLSLAGEPVPLEVLEKVWSGWSIEKEQLEEDKKQVEELWKAVPYLSIEQQGMYLPALIARSRNSQVPENFQSRAEVAPLLSKLIGTGLLSEISPCLAGQVSEFYCHEVTRERIFRWFETGIQEISHYTKAAVFLGYAECFQSKSEEMQNQDVETSTATALKAVKYFDQAKAHKRLLAVVDNLLMISHDRLLMEAIIPYLQNALDHELSGFERVIALSQLGNIYNNAYKPESSLAYFEEAARLAKDPGTPKDFEEVFLLDEALFAIYLGWGNALIEANDLDGARTKYTAAIEMSQSAAVPIPFADTIGAKLELLRIDLKQGKPVSTLLPIMHNHLDSLRGYFESHLSGQDVPEAPDPRRLAETYHTGLDIALEMDYAQSEWDSALTHCDETLRVMRIMKRSEGDVNWMRLQRARILVYQGTCLPEAYTVLEDCLHFFSKNDANRALALSSLAEWYCGQGDLDQAIKLEQNALLITEQLSDPRQCAFSHLTLARHRLNKYRKDQASLVNSVEAGRHMLAALIYIGFIGIPQLARIMHIDYVQHFHRARLAGLELNLPTVADLLNNSSFRHLKQWLDTGEVDLARLQQDIDQKIDNIRQEVLSLDYIPPAHDRHPNHRSPYRRAAQRP